MTGVQTCALPISNLPKPEECLGNYRQFDESDEWLMLFSKLQPRPENVEELYKNFIEETKLEFKAEDAEKIKENWPEWLD